MHKIVLSIIIPVFNKYSFTASCLKDLFQLNSFSTEIIIIDNASSDNTQKELSALDKPNFHYIRNETNIFHSAACNQGYNKATGDNILFLNNDIRVKSNHSDWIDNFLPHCKGNIIGLSMGQLDNQFNFIRESNSELSGNSYLSGWFIASSKENWNKVSHDNDQKIWRESLPFYFNDGDLSFRAKKLGLSLKVIQLPVAHFGMISAKQLNINSLYVEGKKEFMRLHGNKK